MVDQIIEMLYSPLGWGLGVLCVAGAAAIVKQYKLTVNDFSELKSNIEYFMDGAISLTEAADRISSNTRKTFDEALSLVDDIADARKLGVVRKAKVAAAKAGIKIFGR